MSVRVAAGCVSRAWETAQADKSPESEYAHLEASLTALGSLKAVGEVDPTLEKVKGLLQSCHRLSEEDAHTALSYLADLADEIHEACAD